MTYSKTYILFAAVVLATQIVCAQNSLRQIEQKIATGKLLEASQLLLKVDTVKMSLKTKAKYYLLRADYSERSNASDAYEWYMKSLLSYTNTSNIDTAMIVRTNLAYLATSTEYKDKGLARERYDQAQKYLDEYMAYAKASGNASKLAEAWFQYGSANIKKDSIYNLSCFRKALKINNGKDNDLESRINNNLAVLFNESFGIHDSSLFYLRKNVPYFIKNGKSYKLCENYVNQAANYYYLGEHIKSNTWLEKADSLKFIEYSKKIKAQIQLIFSLNYKELSNYKKAFESLQMYQTYCDSIDEDDEMIAISNIEAKYQNKENKLKIEILNKEKKMYSILIALISVLLLAGAISAWFIYKNMRRKQVIAEQEKIIGEQQLEKVLRDQELNSIDSMLEGQEKERRRMADELHDNLGSMLSALKLNFQHLRHRQASLRDEETRLYEKTDELIEEAYQKVRTMAHAQNAGVMASQGLVPAIQKMAEKIAIPNKISIEVVPFGLEERLDNALEIALFRMVQEMVTNVIKHASATQISIHLTQHEQSLNIMIEDNGKGFDPLLVNKNDGMGLPNIERKVIQLGGNFTVDSIPGKGTTIIIDVPI